MSTVKVFADAHTASLTIFGQGEHWFHTPRQLESLYTNELQTSAEPYGWTLDFETRISAKNESASHEIMAADSYVMLAVIDNLGYVTWRYTTDVGQQEYTVTAEDAAAVTGKDIKQCAASASELQSLMQSLSISIQRSIVREN